MWNCEGCVVQRGWRWGRAEEFDSVEYWYSDWATQWWGYFVVGLKKSWCGEGISLIGSRFHCHAIPCEANHLQHALMQNPERQGKEIVQLMKSWLNFAPQSRNSKLFEATESIECSFLASFFFPLYNTFHIITP